MVWRTGGNSPPTTPTGVETQGTNVPTITLNATGVGSGVPRGRLNARIDLPAVVPLTISNTTAVSAYGMNSTLAVQAAWQSA
jgi:hypothetical protein